MSDQRHLLLRSRGRQALPVLAVTLSALAVPTASRAASHSLFLNNPGADKRATAHSPVPEKDWPGTAMLAAQYENVTGSDLQFYEVKVRTASGTVHRFPATTRIVAILKRGTSRKDRWEYSNRRAPAYARARQGVMYFGGSNRRRLQIVEYVQDFKVQANVPVKRSATTTIAVSQRPAGDNRPTRVLLAFQREFAAYEGADDAAISNLVLGRSPGLSFDTGSQLVSDLTKALNKQSGQISAATAPSYADATLGVLYTGASTATQLDLVEYVQGYEVTLTGAPAKTGYIATYNAVKEPAAASS